jgi:hypothetical protein
VVLHDVDGAEACRQGQGRRSGAEAVETGMKMGRYLRTSAAGEAMLL